MKFKTFMKIFFASVVLALGGTCYGCYRLVSSSDSSSSPREYTTTTIVTPSARATSGSAVPVNPTTTQATPVAAGGPGALRSFDQAVLDKAGTRISGDKVKDALPGSVKVNLYQDKGAQGVNRAKLDLDRDDKFDEKWTFENEGGKWKVKRQVAPADDEKYTEEYRLEEGRWVSK